MRKLLVYACVFGVSFFLACAKPKSAIDHWKEQYGTDDPVNNMRFPKETSETKPENGKVADETGKEKTGPKKENEPLVDESLLKKIPKKTELKSVRITADKAPLLKGPGTRFEKIGEANSGDLFSLLRTLKGPEGETTWHQIQDDKGNKFFIADSQAALVPHMEKIKRSEKTSIEKIQTIFDPTPPLPKELVEAKTITLNFEQTEIYDVITTFCELLKIDYMIEGGIAGKITLQTFNNIPVEDLYSVLEQILAVNNITVVKSGNFYRFLPVKDAITKPLSIYYGDQANIPQNDRLIIQIIPLKHVSVNSMKAIIAPLLTKNATFLDVPETRNLMIVELASSIKRIVKVVQALDVDQLAQSDVHHYKIEHADAFSLAGEIGSVFSVIGYKESIGKSLIFLPIDRLNSILVVSAFPDLWPTIELWIQKLDQPYLMTRKMGTFIYFVQNGSSERLATILTSLFRTQVPGAAAGGSRPGPKPAIPGVSPPKPFVEPPKETAPKPPVPGEAPKIPTSPPVAGAAATTIAPTVTVSGGIIAPHEEGLDEDVKNLIVVSDKDTNALVIRINPRSYPAILEILTKLDLMPQQVMIEVLIMDLTLDHSTLTGLEWAMKNTGKLNYSAGNQGLSDAGKSLGGLLGTSATSLFTSGVSFFVTDPSKFIALLQAFASDSKANVLANPVLVTANNKSANIAITNEIPIVTTTSTPSTSGSQISEQVQFRSVGVKLTIDPKINKENYVHLKISQEISSRGVDVRNQPSFNNRTLSSEVVLKDNQILVMGGLMQTTVTTSNQGAPGLKDIPIFGRLFGTNSDALNKTELMIFISPHIISNLEDADYVTNHVKYRLTDFGSLKNKTASLAQPGKDFMKDFEDLEKPSEKQGEPGKVNQGNESSQANGKSKSAITEFLESQKPGNGVPEKINGGKPEPAKPKNGGAGKSNAGNSKTNGGTSDKK